MPRNDLVLLHAPSVYDFREKSMLFGPVSDVVPSTQVFEMYPIGFLTMLEYLQRHGYSVRIINVALKMLRSRRFDAGKLIQSLDPVAFGLDLHWLVHAQGSLELAALVKKCHPDMPVIMGGLSASYFHEELVRYPQVDYVIRGDSAEEPLRQLMCAIQEHRPLDDVPNLTWQDPGGVRVNAFTHVPPDLDGISFDYRQMMRSSVRHVDVLGHLPFLTWPAYPIVPSLPCRGCVHNCVTCGGSSSAYKGLCGRRAPAFRSPKLLAQDIAAVSRYIRGPVMSLSDIRQAGLQYAEAFLDELAREKVTNHIAFEFFSPPSREFLETVARAVPNFSIQISPESHDEEVRSAFGRKYDNHSLEEFVQDALDLGCKRLDLFFMLGLPKQTPESVRETTRYCEDLLAEFEASHPRQILPFISPLAPFLDPGSRAFEEPQRHGYRLFHKSLEDHRQALLSPSWKYTLNYETIWMNRDELAASTYEAALGLTRMKQKHGFLSREVAQGLEKRIAQEWEILDKLDQVLLAPDGPARNRTIQQIMKAFDRVGPATLCKKDEMNWPAGFMRFKPLRVIQGAFFGD
jgi:B12-binding domain/radical SAM domain protein